MEIGKIHKGDAEYPARLLRLGSPPKQLYVAGQSLTKLLQHHTVAIVGSRTMTAYGRQITHDFARALAEQGVVIVSGLALGVDAAAHRAALEVGGATIAVVPRSLNDIYPASHLGLSRMIAERNGVLISEYPEGTTAYKSNFVARNRIVAGLADVILITEAAIDSGSLHTARFARSVERPVLAVPGPINSPRSAGANELLRKGALPALHPDDVLRALGIHKRRTRVHRACGQNREEQLVLTLLMTGVYDAQQLLARSGLPVTVFNQTISMLEIDGKIQMSGFGEWGLA